MKKTVSWFLVLLMLLSVQPSMANTQKTGAQNLYDYKFIQGRGDGDLAVDAFLTRAEASVLLAEMYGVKAVAMDYNKTSAFSDVKKDMWHFGYINYAQTQGWIKGYPDGTFKPSNTVTQREWASMLTNALGHPMNWEKVIDELMTIGIVIPAANPDTLRRGEAFEAMWMAVNTPKFGEQLPLGVVLGKLEKPVLPPEPLRVTQGKIKSLKEVVLALNVPLDLASTQTLKHFEVSANGVQGLEVVSTVYDESALTLTLALNKPVLQQTDVSVTIKGLKTKEGLLTEETKLTVNMLDVTPPELLSAKTIGTRAIKVFFSEPIRSVEEGKGNYYSEDLAKLPLDAFVLNDGKISIRDITLQNNQREAIIEVYADLVNTVKVKAGEGARDYANFVITSPAMEIPVVKDTTPPTVIGYENASPTGVTLLFSEDIKVVNGAQSLFYHGTNTNTIDAPITQTAVDGHKLRLTFTRNILSSGANAVLVSQGAITDYSNNRNATQQIAVTLAADTEPPYVVGGVVPLSEKRIRLTFSEHLFNKSGEAQSRASYKLTDVNSANLSQKISTIVYRPDTTSVEIEFTEELKGNFLLSVEGLKDHSNNVMAPNVFAFEMKDLTPPNPKLWSARVYNTGTANQMVKIRFDEIMATSGNHSILDVSKYVINGKALDALDASLLRFELEDDGASLLIHYPGANVRGGFDFSASAPSARVDIARTADAAGNYIPEFSVSLKLENKGFIAVESAAQVARNQVKVVISDWLIGVNLGDFALESASKTYRPVSYAFEVEGRKTHLTMTFAEDIVGSNLVLKVVGTGTVNKYGETLNPASAPMPLLDQMAPYVLKLASGADHVVYNRLTGVIDIRFSETIDPRTVSLLSFNVGNFSIDDISADGQNIRIRLAAKDRDKVVLYDVVTQAVEVRDLAGNGVRNLVLQIQQIQ